MTQNCNTNGWPRVKAKLARIPASEQLQLDALNELFPLSLDEDGAIPNETLNNNIFLYRAIEDWLQEAYEGQLLTATERWNLESRIWRILGL